MEDLEQRMGYVFQDKSLLRQALIHSSYVNEHHMSRLECNERLEFLGDAVLELSSSQFLFEKYPDFPEGELTKLRASIVCEPTLADCAEELSLGQELLIGRGEDRTGGREKASLLSDALEAVIGAIYLDGGFANAKEFVVRLILNDIEHKKLFFDSKTILQEFVQSRDLGDLSYELLKEEGPDHSKVFTSCVRIGGEEAGTGTGRNKKLSEQAAAYEAILRLGQ
ncbi:ribonuclease III [Cuneatibacter sp. NSJ-177]|uniref:ribonuclease III n=1 Tax=Cuneatibacter sp. NSJ-177 TaxID=2931401 RepID=UPI001FCFDEAC|nr:ribonuclease III [Cuneatibacter sp. NSJ-177]MCJ7834241.1 ribonuclease III [Cuneatibacter sp. NSJ-177]